MSEYKPIYQLYVLSDKELIKLSEDTDKELMLDRLQTARKQGYKQAHLQYSFKNGGKVEQAAIGALLAGAARVGVGAAKVAGRGIAKGAKAAGRGAVKAGRAAGRAGKAAGRAGVRGLNQLGDYTDQYNPDQEYYGDVFPTQSEVIEVLSSAGKSDHWLNLKPVEEWDSFDLTQFNKFKATATMKAGGKTNPCWNDYEMIGTKEKDGKKVPNCVPEMKEGGKTKVARNYRVRFHLGRGKNFMNWKVEQIKPREDWFYVPDDVNIIMTNCVLTNKPLRAEKIYTGEINKEPIAYVQCENVSVIDATDIDISKAKRLSYNPRVNPYWFDEDGNNIDNSEWGALFTVGRAVYTESKGQVYELGGLAEMFETGGQVGMFDNEPKETLILPEEPELLDLFAEVSKQPDLTAENVAEQIRSQRLSEPEPQLTLLSFGGGQDSWAILYKMITDSKFRKDYAPNDLVVVMSDTGNEHPYTYKANLEAKKLCEKNNIPFYFLKAGDKYHTAGWTDLKSNMRRNRTILAAWGVKSCTASLKIAPIDKFMYEYMSNLYGYTYQWGKPIGKNWQMYESQMRSKARVIIGFAKNEETRVLNTLKMTRFLPKWKQKYVQFCYPLIEQGWDRAAAQKIIKENHPYLIPPSNCMICFFQSNEEIVWLERNYPDEFAEWVELENSKLTAEKWLSSKKNMGVYGNITLTQKLEQAKNSINESWLDGALAHKKIGEWTDDELWEYKLSHGHCVKSVY